VVRAGPDRRVLGIVLVALSMRTGVAVIGPVFSEISGELHLSVIVLSLMGAAPPVFFALAGSSARGSPADSVSRAHW